MDYPLAICRRLDDRELASRIDRLVHGERSCLAVLIAHLAVFDDRELYADEGYPSLFAYCTERLGYSEGAAYKRIQAARAARKYPLLLQHLASGELHLEAVVLLAPHLTPENHEDLLELGRGKSKRALAEALACLAPREVGMDCIRRLSAPASETCTPIQEPMPQKIEPLAPGRTRVGFTASDDVVRLLDRAREVLLHKHPAGKLNDLLREALTALLESKDPEQKALRRLPRGNHAGSRSAAPTGSSKTNRAIPQRVRDEVWRRDGGQCAFVASSGRRCRERGGLEFDHIIPFAMGGRSDDTANIRLLCRAHNKLAARRTFGRAKMRDAQRRKRE